MPKLMQAENEEPLLRLEDVPTSQPWRSIQAALVKIKTSPAAGTEHERIPAHSP